MNCLVLNCRMMKILKTVLFTFLMAFTGVQISTAQITEKPDYGKFAIVNGTIHTVTNGIIEGGVILIDGSTITYVGRPSSDIDESYKRIDASGKHIYPGFIDSGTLLGLKEIGAVDVTNDQAELGAINPQVRAFTAINPSSVNIPVTRVNGVTNVLTHPVSGTIAGKAVLLDLYGYAPDSLAVKPNAALHISWPSAVKSGSWDDRKPEEIKKEYEKKLKELNDFWAKADAYDRMMTAYINDPKNKTKPDQNNKLDAMREVMQGDLPVMITVNRKENIENALEWMATHEGIDFILSSVAEGWRVADQIASAAVPCIVGPVLRTPTKDYVNYQRPYQNASILHNAGVKVAIRTGDAENVRNLPYNAAYTATYGLGVEQAVKAVTINPAEIFGVDDKIGSLEEGKQANLFISNGDPFEPATQIEQVFIRGFKIPMVSRHTQLYEEYLNRDVRE